MTLTGMVLRRQLNRLFGKGCRLVSDRCLLLGMRGESVFLSLLCENAATTGYYLTAFQAETLRPNAYGSEHNCIMCH